MSEYFPEPNSLGGKVKVELDLSNYAKKTDLKNVAGAHTWKFAKKVDLANLTTNLSILKIKVDKLDVYKLVLVPVDLSKLSDAMENNVVKKYVYNAKIKNIEDKISHIPNLATKTTLNGKIN